MKKEMIIELRKQGLSFGQIAYRVKCKRQYCQEVWKMHTSGYKWKYEMSEYSSSF
jgi:hypothetical protein